MGTSRDTSPLSPTTARLPTLRLSPLPTLLPTPLPLPAPLSTLLPLSTPPSTLPPFTVEPVRCPTSQCEALPGREQGDHPVQGLRSHRCRRPRLPQPPQRSPQQEGTCRCWTRSCHRLRSSSN